jgi:hypothetical protein
VSRQQSHNPAMLPLALLEDEREPFAIWYFLFRQSPKLKLKRAVHHEEHEETRRETK